MKLRRSRGFKLGRKAVRVFRWFSSRRAPPRSGWTRLGGPSCSVGAVSKLFSWGRSLRQRTKGLSFEKRGSGYIRVEQEPMVKFEQGSVNVPKGHLAVYVGEDDGDTCRVIVPVLYFNHPLFADLLRDAEKVYGFDHPGGIQIPCPKSEFEDVKMKIAAAGGGSCRGRRSWRQLLMSSSRHENLDH